MTAGVPQILVRTGTAEPASMALPPGEALGPLSIGREGTWRVVAPGVLGEHAFLYFNGSELFLQSADPNSPTTVNGSPIPGSWTAVYAPCEIAFGGARLWFGPPGEAPRPRPPPVPSRPPPGPSHPPPGRAPAAPSAPPMPMPSVPRLHEVPSVEESTRQVSIEEIQQSVRRPPSTAVAATLKSGSAPPPSFGAGPPSFGAAPAPSFGAAPAPSFGGPPASVFDPFTLPGPSPSLPSSTMGAMGPGPSFGAPPPGPPSLGGPPSFGPDAPLPGAPGSPPIPQGAPGADAEKSSKIGMMWRESSTPKKALVVLMLPLIWSVWVIFTDKPPAARPANQATSAATEPSSTPSAGAPTAEPTTSASPAAGPVVVPTPAPTGTASSKAGAGGDPRTTSAKTREREAADAVAVGAYAKAADLYDELAKAHPEVAAYGQAARIMRAKARR
jgi:hypothetical protein